MEIKKVEGFGWELITNKKEFSSKCNICGKEIETKRFYFCAEKQIAVCKECNFDNRNFCAIIQKDKEHPHYCITKLTLKEEEDDTNNKT